ncbi:MAG: hypothetical protein UX91_C0006G0165 [Candidatus Amesbacteria bacterium GW2011_GWB1_47_19]|nr:MAG: hypothetical protein UW51_C0002G0166 [Candidatus Amesbacteria bacterium GW2011_GWA1_44_24]KKU31243.1 MAG: hypothetical protein UX46_C0006G0035 [Candidatus Amesbacteria bacterium GW2011_GWC1_46_24]KKU67103.1 MAG: hypothetical protein UX91_C0006G0165 [Candidatus Amesbacteria bacterium GW2011_GWB1_47_19]
MLLVAAGFIPDSHRAMCLSTLASTPYCPPNLSVIWYICSEENFGWGTLVGAGVGLAVGLAVGLGVGVDVGVGVGVADGTGVGVAVSTTFPAANSIPRLVASALTPTIIKNTKFPTRLALYP